MEFGKIKDDNAVSLNEYLNAAIMAKSSGKDFENVGLKLGSHTFHVVGRFFNRTSTITRTIDGFKSALMGQYCNGNCVSDNAIQKIVDDCCKEVVAKKSLTAQNIIAITKSVCQKTAEAIKIKQLFAEAYLTKKYNLDSPINKNSPIARKMIEKCVQFIKNKQIDVSLGCSACEKALDEDWNRLSGELDNLWIIDLTEFDSLVKKVALENSAGNCLENSAGNNVGVLRTHCTVGKSGIGQKDLLSKDFSEIKGIVIERITENLKLDRVCADVQAAMKDVIKDELNKICPAVEWGDFSDKHLFIDKSFGIYFELKDKIKEVKKYKDKILKGNVDVFREYISNWLNENFLNGIKYLYEKCKEKTELFTENDLQYLLKVVATGGKSPPKGFTDSFVWWLENQQDGLKKLNAISSEKDYVAAYVELAKQFASYIAGTADFKASGYELFAAYVKNHCSGNNFPPIKDWEEYDIHIVLKGCENQDDLGAGLICSRMCIIDPMVTVLKFAID